MRRLVGAGREERKQGATRRSRLGGAAPPTGVKGKAAGNARRGEKKAVARGRKTTGHHTFFALGVPQRRQPQGLTKPGIAAVSVAAAAATSRATEHPRTFRGKRRFRDGRAANTPARTPGCSRKNLLRPVWSAAYICAAGQQAKRGQGPRFSKRCAHTADVPALAPGHCVCNGGASPVAARVYAPRWGRHCRKHATPSSLVSRLSSCVASLPLPLAANGGNGSPPFCASKKSPAKQGSAIGAGGVPLT